jgi:hypothetical protein
MRFGQATDPFFRTAVHEMGHAMGLYHNTVDNGFMNTTDVIALNATAANPFPTNVRWAFATNDAKQLRHYPDLFVRPGGVPFGEADPAIPPITPNDLAGASQGLQLRVTPVLDVLPLAAPVRLELELANTGSEPFTAPARLAMSTSEIEGTVVLPGGEVRTFRPIIKCLEGVEQRTLAPGESVFGSITLLRGAEGALFPMAGLYRIEVRIRLSIPPLELAISGAAEIMVTPVENREHAKAALCVLSEPDTLLTLVFGGDHLVAGIAAVQAALQSAVLRPHFAYIEAKRVAERFGRRKPERQTAARLISSETVMSVSERRKAARWKNGSKAAEKPSDEKAYV